jgi:hypothetical protein
MQDYIPSVLVICVAANATQCKPMPPETIGFYHLCSSKCYPMQDYDVGDGHQYRSQCRGYPQEKPTRLIVIWYVRRLSNGPSWTSVTIDILYYKISSSYSTCGRFISITVLLSYPAEFDIVQAICCWQPTVIIPLLVRYAILYHVSNKTLRTLMNVTPMRSPGHSDSPKTLQVDQNG